MAINHKTRRAQINLRITVEKLIRKYEKGNWNSEQLQQDIGERIGIEKTICGACILDWEAINTFRAMTRGMELREVFLSDRCQIVMQHILDLDNASVPVDFTTLCHSLCESGDMRRMGGPGFVGSLQSYVFSTGNVSWHINLLLEHNRKTEAANIAVKLLDIPGGKDLNQALVEHADKLKSLVSTEAQFQTPTLAGAEATLERLLTDDVDGTTKIPWYWSWLHQNTGGLRRKKLHVVIAPPNYGKTAFALQQATYTARTLKKNVCMILMESDEDESFTRFAMQTHGVDGRKLLAGPKAIRDDERRQLRASVESWLEMENYLWWTLCGSKSASQILVMLHEWRRQTGKQLDLLVIDHMNAMASDIPRVAPTEHHAIAYNVLQIQNMAVEFDCPVLLLAQPVKESYSGETSREPTLGDVKGSGEAIQTAKQIIWLWYQPQLRRKHDVIPGQFVITKANNAQEGAHPCLYLQRSCLHIEDTALNRKPAPDGYGDLITAYGGVPVLDKPKNKQRKAYSYEHNGNDNHNDSFEF